MRCPRQGPPTAPRGGDEAQAARSPPVCGSAGSTSMARVLRVGVLAQTLGLPLWAQEVSRQGNASQVAVSQRKVRWS